jgi:neutral ceramidase
MSDPTTRGDGPHLADPAPAPSRARRWLRRLAMALTASLFVIGPWPVDDSRFDGSPYQQRTLDRLDAAPKTGPAGSIRVGLAEVDLTPDSPRPLAGFIGQIRTPYIGVDTPCYARALTVESASGAVTVLTADLLLINAKLARAVIERAGVRADQVYFTSSHTHGGPGGWGDHPLEMLVAGAYDPSFFESLADQLAGVVRRSRATTEPAEMAFVEVQARARQRNRIDPSLPTHDALSSLIFRPFGASSDAPPLAILVVFGAHATVSHPVPPRLGGDYPAALVSELKRQTGARAVLFASGAVGDASPDRPKAASQSKSAEALGIALANDLKTALPSARFARNIEVGSLRVEVDLPPVRLPFFASKLRFSPLLTWWIADRRTHLHALRLGPAVLVGFPGDYSGHLADSLAESIPELGLSVVPTSFDGDFRGYLVSPDVFHRKPCYETRWMNFYGPGLGAYFNDLAWRMVEHTSNASIEPTRPAMASDDFGPRLSLAVLLGWASVVGWRGRRELVTVLVHSGVFTVGMAFVAVLAFEIDPNLFDWGKFGLPDWLRLVGFPLGIVALTLPKRPGRVVLFFGLSCALLSASWIVVLMALRGCVKVSQRSQNGFVPRKGASNPSKSGSVSAR